MNRKTKKILTAVVFALMLMPVALGPFCHCCEASAGDQTVIVPVQDHSCCPDSNRLSANCNLPAIHQARFVTPSLSEALVFKKDISHATSILLADSPAQAFDFQNSREFSPPLGFHTPLFLSLQVLRI